VLWNSELLMGNKFYCTGTTGTLILEALKEKHPEVEWDFTILKSGPLGGDQQMGSRIVDGQIDYLFFFTDPMTLQPHDTDVKALTRLAGVENIVFCCNRSTADHIQPSVYGSRLRTYPSGLFQLYETVRKQIRGNGSCRIGK
jgi:methylglyoxal synthase